MKFGKRNWSFIVSQGAKQTFGWWLLNSRWLPWNYKQRSKK